MSRLLPWAISFALMAVALAMVFAAIRLLRGRLPKTACWRWIPCMPIA